MSGPLRKLEEALLGARRGEDTRSPEAVWPQETGEPMPEVVRRLLSIPVRPGDQRPFRRQELEKAGTDFVELLRVMAKLAGQDVEPEHTGGDLLPGGDHNRPATPTLSTDTGGRPTEDGSAGGPPAGRTSPLESVHPFQRRPKEL